MVRSELTADDSLAAIRARSRFGIAIAAIIRIIATTISSSINEKPFLLFISLVSMVSGSRPALQTFVAATVPSSVSGGAQRYFTDNKPPTHKLARLLPVFR